MAVERIILRDLPGIAEIERQYLMFLDNKLMKDEIEALERALEAKSLELFGITQRDTEHWVRPNDAAAVSYQEWERHFEFIEYAFEEEDSFWEAFGIDVTDEKGDQLACMEEFGRQLVCALKRLHPEAVLTFRRGDTAEQLKAAAEAWGKRLLVGRR